MSGNDSVIATTCAAVCEVFPGGTLCCDHLPLHLGLHHDPRGVDWAAGVASPGGPQITSEDIFAGNMEQNTRLAQLAEQMVDLASARAQSADPSHERWAIRVRAKLAQVFNLGMGVGWDKHAMAELSRQAVTDPEPSVCSCAFRERVVVNLASLNEIVSELMTGLSDDSNPTREFAHVVRNALAGHSGSLGFTFQGEFHTDPPSGD
jgi:hypothetical protein